MYGLNSALAASRRTHSELDGFEVPRHTGSVKIEAVSCSKFEKKFAKGDWPDVIVGLRNSDNYRGGKEPAAVVVELVVGDELDKKRNTFETDIVVEERKQELRRPHRTTRSFATCMLTNIML